MKKETIETLCGLMIDGIDSKEITDFNYYEAWLVVKDLDVDIEDLRYIILTLTEGFVNDTFELDKNTVKEFLEFVKDDEDKIFIEDSEIQCYKKLQILYNFDVAYEYMIVNVSRDNESMNSFKDAFIALEEKIMEI